MRSQNNTGHVDNRGYLNYLRNSIHLDAVNHGLWNGESPYDAARRISDEVEELMDAACDREHFAEELADVIIMALSTAGHLNIDIHGAVMRKMDINTTRPYRHEVSEK